jgi:Zn ribbon nucleic-acid-binding protein
MRPMPEDYAARDRRDTLKRAELDGHNERSASNFSVTGICTRVIRPDAVIGMVCPVCYHQDSLHSGAPNPSIDACVACVALSSARALDALIDRVNKER